MSIVNRIQYLCSQNGIKIKPLEEKLGIANGSIKRWDNSSPSCERLLKVAQYFNVSVDWLLTGDSILEKEHITDEELTLLAGFRKLSNYEKTELIEILDLKLRKEKEKAKSYPSENKNLA